MSFVELHHQIRQDDQLPLPAWHAGLCLQCMQAAGGGNLGNLGFGSHHRLASEHISTGAYSEQATATSNSTQTNNTKGPTAKGGGGAKGPKGQRARGQRQTTSNPNQIKCQSSQGVGYTHRTHRGGLPKEEEGRNTHTHTRKHYNPNQIKCQSSQKKYCATAQEIRFAKGP